MKNRAKKKAKTTRINGITIRHMGPERFTVDLRSITQNGAAWKSFKTLGEAEAYAEQLHIERVNKGVEGFKLTDRQRRDALDALTILGEGVTLVEAAREYRRRYPDQSAEMLPDTVERLKEWMRREGRREISIREQSRKCRLFIEDHPDRATQSIDRQDITDWVERRGWKGVTAKNYRNAIISLTNFYHGSMRKRQQRDDKPVVIWDVKTVQQLFDATARHEPELIPAIAVLFFAGLRPHEMMRLKWSQIDFASGHIRLEGEQVKTRAARIISLTPNATAWLTAYHAKGPIIISETWYRKRREKAMRHAGIEAWPKDVSRHCFASYLYAQRQDAGYVASQLGHWQGLDTFARHYRGVTTPADAEKYFKIMPRKGKVIKLRRNTA